jgi:phosphoglycolate phosphatase-like HAD superfamily hydrolase
MRVIFLDFDGVLVNRKSWYVRSGKMSTADPDCVAALNRITDVTGACIVVSSTWRVGQTLDSLEKILRSWHVTGFVASKTPQLDGMVGPVWVNVTRGQEIQAWLDHNPGCEFVILDDDSDMDRLHARHIKTEFDVGLTAADAEKAIHLLGPLC